MRKLKGFKQLNRTHSHRRALYRNMVEALFKNERIRTTTVKAKEIRRIAEKIITRAKVKNVHNIRIINKLIKDKLILMKLFDDIAPRYAARPGGYTRIYKLARRKGDGAEMAYLELVEELEVMKKKKKKKNIKADTVEKNERMKEKDAEKVSGEEEHSEVTDVKSEIKED